MNKDGRAAPRCGWILTVKVDDRMDENTRRALAWLERDRLHHMDMTEPLRFGEAEVLAQGPQGVLVNLDGVLMLSAESEAGALALCRAVPRIENLLNHQAEYSPALMQAFGLHQVTTYYQVARFSRQPLDAGAADVQIRPIGVEQLAFVQAHYKVPMPAEYLRERLASGVMAGAFAGGEIVGFAGEHDEGTLGMLEVLPAFRRRGVGRALAAHIVNRRLAAGKLSYGQVAVGNEASLAMQRSLGFEVGNRPVAWLVSRALSNE